ncbi:hypothetical protein J3F84DRAFT_386987 [Trichoderma pleuroticola]
MRSFIACILPITLSISTVLANTPIHESQITGPGGNWNLAGASAPDWHFSFTEPCYPTGAFYDSAQTQMHRPGPKECAPATRDPKGHAHDFPTYFLTRKCDYGNGHVEWHVMYNVYFPYSTNSIQGHDHDWEWLVIKWEPQPNNPGYWHRKSIVLEAHGKTTEYKWSDYPLTVSADNKTWRKDASHPVVFFSRDGHGLSTSTADIGQWYWADDWLADGSNFPARNWGSADSPPNTFEANGSHDLCWAM